MSGNNDEPSIMKAQCCGNELFAIVRDEKNKDCFLIYLLNVQRKQQKDMIKVNSKLSAYILD